MSQTTFKVSAILSAVVALMAAAASVGGLWLTDLYRATPEIVAVWRSTDRITLVVALPLLLASLALALRGSPRAQIVWMGLIGYMLYNYAFYLYGAAFNRFFLLYICLTALSIYALIFGLMSINVTNIGRIFRASTPVRWIGGYMLFFALGLGGVEIASIIQTITFGHIPPDIAKLQIIYATDLTLLVPGVLLGGWLLLRRQLWGYIVAAMVNIKAVAYVLVLLTMSLTVSWDPPTPLYLLLGAGSLASCIALLANMQPDKEKGVHLPGVAASIRS
jgi:hypothetical protein